MSTWNPSDLFNVTLSGNNLVATQTSTDGGVRGTTSQALSSGKFYFEITATGGASLNWIIGVGNSSWNEGNTPGFDANLSIGFKQDGGVVLNSVNIVNQQVIWASGAVLGIALDTTNKKIWITADGSTWGGTAATPNPATNTNGYDISAMTGPLFPLFWSNTANAAATINFGAKLFAYSIPSGFARWDPNDNPSVLSGAGALTAAALAYMEGVAGLTPAGNVATNGVSYLLASSALAGAGNGAFSAFVAVVDVTESLSPVGAMSANSTVGVASGGGGVVTSTWNLSDKGVNCSLSNSNFTATDTAALVTGVRANTSKSAGRVYFEIQMTGGDMFGGLANANWLLNANSLGFDSNNGISARGDGGVYSNSTWLGYGPTLISGATLGLAVDFGNNFVWFTSDGVNYVGPSGFVNPSLGASGFSLVNINKPLFPAWGSDTSGATGTVNFGATPFKFTPPSGFNAWDPYDVPNAMASVGSLAANGFIAVVDKAEVLAGAGTLAANNPALIESAGALIAGASNIVTGTIQWMQAQASPAGSGTVYLWANELALETATLAGAGTLFVDSSIGVLVKFASVGALVAQGFVAKLDAPVLAGAGTLYTYAAVSGLDTASFAGTGALTSLGSIPYFGSATLSGQVFFVSPIQSAFGQIDAAENLPGSGVMTTQSFVAAVDATEQLAGSGNVSVGAILQEQAAAVLQGAGSVTGSQFPAVIDQQEPNWFITGRMSHGPTFFGQIDTAETYPGAGSLAAQSFVAAIDTTEVYTGTGLLAANGVFGQIDQSQLSWGAQSALSASGIMQAKGLAGLPGAGGLFIGSLQLEAVVSPSLAGSGVISLSTIVAKWVNNVALSGSIFMVSYSGVGTPGNPGSMPVQASMAVDGELWRPVNPNFVATASPAFTRTVTAGA